MAENQAIMYVVLVVLVILLAIGFYVAYDAFFSWLCSGAGDSLTACN